MDVTARLAGNGFSARSQESFHREAALRKTLSSTLGKLRRLKQAIEAGEAELERHKQAFVNNEPYATKAIADELAKIRGWRDEVSVYEPLADQVQAQIEALVNPAAELVQARADVQKSVAVLVLERLGCDKELEGILQTAQQLLEKRAETTSRLWSLLDALNFTFADDHLDEERFRPLQEGIPQNVAETSEAWVARFLGETQPVGTFRVLEETLFLRETLASPHAYQRGDRIELTADQLAEAGAGDKMRVAYPPEVRDGAVRAGTRTEIFEPRVEALEESETDASAEGEILTEV